MRASARPLDQLLELWKSTHRQRADLVKRELMESGNAMPLVPMLPEEDPSSRLCSLCFNLLSSALDSLGHLYRVEPERKSKTAKRWAEVLWAHDGVDGAFSAQMTVVDRVARLNGSALVILHPEDGGLSVRVYPPSRFVALSTEDDREVAAVLLLESGSDGVYPFVVEQKMAATTPTLEQQQQMLHKASLEYGTVPSTTKVWRYIDARISKGYTGEYTSLVPIEDGEVEHGWGVVPAVVVSSDLIQTGLSGHPLGGPDLVANVLSTQKLLSECGDTSLMQRGQPTLSGNHVGPLTLSPKHVIQTTQPNGFTIVPSNGNPSVMLEAGRAFAALAALSIGAPVTSMWRLADLTEADLRAAEMVISQDRPHRARVMARAERKIAKMMAAAWKFARGETLEPWTVEYKVPQMPLSASERLELEKEKDDRKLAPREEIAQALSPELSQSEIRRQVKAADKEAEKAVSDLALVAGHAGDVEDGRSDLSNTASDARSAAEPTSTAAAAGPTSTAAAGAAKG